MAAAARKWTSAASGTALRSTMTPPSRSGAAAAPAGGRKAAGSQGVASVARRLLALAPMAFAGACILPPPLEIGTEDAGVSSPPVVEQVLPDDFATPGPPIKLQPDQPRTMTLVVRDADLEDTVFVRFFVDYNRPDPGNFKASCSAPPPLEGGPLRNVDCETQTLCDGIAPDNDIEHFLEAVVADRTFLETSDPEAEGQPVFRALPSGGASTVTSWTMICLE